MGECWNVSQSQLPLVIIILIKILVFLDLPWRDRHGITVVAPIEWDLREQAWIVWPIVVSNSFKRHPGVFPLRMRPGAESDEVSFDGFIDGIFDPLLESAGVLAGGPLAAPVEVEPSA